MSSTYAGGQAPAWSPGGDKIAFGRESRVYVMNADGREPKEVCVGAYPT